jgi:hypothetical protein
MVAERRAKILRRAYYANVLWAASWMISSVKRSARSLPTSKAGARAGTQDARNRGRGASASRSIARGLLLFSLRRLS